MRGRGGFVLMCGGTDAVLWGGWPQLKLRNLNLKKNKATGNLAHSSIRQIGPSFFF